MKLVKILKEARIAFLSSIALIVCFTISSCNYLDIVPDDVATIDHAFHNRNEAQKYLYTLYSYTPGDGNVHFNPGFLAGDELWIPYQTAITSYAFRIARGDQRVSSPYMDAWSGHYSGAGNGDNYPLFQGIRKCNTFLKHVKDTDQVPDLNSIDRERWIGEAQFLKAYYHFYLMRMYGPVPIIDENVPVFASEDEVQLKRQPVDSVVSYVTALLDSAAVHLPEQLADPTTELGRVTKPAALAMKARVLLTAASPLFNGNPDYADFTDKQGRHLFSTDKDPSKWQKAADAAMAAIQSAEATGHQLYEFEGSKFALSDTTKTKLSVRQAVAKPWNNEIIWGNSNSLTSDLQLQAMAPVEDGEDPNNAHMILSAPLKIAKLFYTEHGVPMSQDKTLDYTDINELRTVNHDERFNIGEGAQTARLNFDRSPRFYADLGFDKSTWYKYDSPTNSDEDTYVLNAKAGEFAGKYHAFYYNMTGYYVKKLVNWHESLTSSSATYKTYAWPEIRLADVYLMYAEAENEANGPSQKIFDYLDKIRNRAGLEGVKESWDQYSNRPDQYTTKDGLREIIHRERLIEMAFEGSRFWDLRRWKEASEKLNEDITGWNVKGEDAASYYQKTTVYQQQFIAPRDYLWPIPESSVLRNQNLVQNPGW